MVGLSVILENYSDRSPQILSKGAMIIKTNSSPASGFLDNCFLCRRKLLPGNDIFMYKGDRAFCTKRRAYNAKRVFVRWSTPVQLPPRHPAAAREGELRLKSVCVFPFLPFVDSVSIPTVPGTVLSSRRFTTGGDF